MQVAMLRTWRERSAYYGLERVRACLESKVSNKFVNKCPCPTILKALESGRVISCGRVDANRTLTFHALLAPAGTTIHSSQGAKNIAKPVRHHLTIPASFIR